MHLADTITELLLPLRRYHIRTNHNPKQTLLYAAAGTNEGQKIKLLLVRFRTNINARYKNFSEASPCGDKGRKPRCDQGRGRVISKD